MRGYNTVLAVLLALISTSSAHLFLKYPGTRGNNLHNDHGNTSKCIRGTIDDYNGKEGCFPYGMEWMYPCGGLPLTTNRTHWPLTGGAVSFQPGWATGHQTAIIYINLGIGTVPLNMSHPMVPPFMITAPTNNEYPNKEVCIPQVGIPANLSLHDGQNATIQIVEAAKHGAALFSCVDVILTSNMSKVREVNHHNCRNSSDLGFSLIYATTQLGNDAISSLKTPNSLGVATLAMVVMFAGFFL